MSYILPSSSPLLTPIEIGDFTASNRIFMAPLTRLRAGADGIPTDLQVEHYRQRATAGLIIAEATGVSETSNGAYPNTPSIHTDEQQDGWARIASAVHAEGGHIFVQLWHVGRIAHPAISGHESVGPSPIASGTAAHTPTGKQDLPAPRELGQTEIAEIVDDFRKAARRAIDAGLDGVEIHAANGYLLHQFLGDDSNHRTDEYGGTPEKRARMVLEVVGAVADEIGADRTAIRLSPGQTVNGMHESEPWPAHRVVLQYLSDKGLAYVHVLIEPADPVLAQMRAVYPGNLVVNTGFRMSSDFDELNELVATGVADAVAVGRYFISNPDLIERITRGYELTEPDQSTFYSAGPKGYTDYPVLTK